MNTYLKIINIYFKDEKGPQTPNIKLYRKEEPEIMIQDINSNSSCFPDEINQGNIF